VAAFVGLSLSCGCARVCGLESDYLLDESLEVAGVGGAGSGGAGGASMPDPVAHYLLDEESGDIAGDAAGGLEGRLEGGATWLPDGGRIGGAVEFDGVDGQIELGIHDVFDFGPNDFTITVWYRFPPAAADNEEDWTILQHGNVNEPFYRLRLVFAAAAGRRLSFDLGDLDGEQGTPLVCDNHFDDKQETWFMIAAVREPLALSLYVNGALWAQTGVRAFDTSTVHDTTLGKTPGNLAPMPGRLDDVRFYDVSLGPEQVARLYLETEEPWTPPPCTQ
jgi:hypothetical protein